jgi:hypothetical protein
MRNHEAKLKSGRGPMIDITQTPPQYIAPVITLKRTHWRRLMGRIRTSHPGSGASPDGVHDRNGLGSDPDVLHMRLRGIVFCLLS